MLAAYRVQEHNKTAQTVKPIQFGKKQTQRTESLLEIAVRKTMFCQSFTSPLQRVVPYVLVHDPPSIFQDRIINTSKYPTLIPGILIPTNETWLHFQR